MVTGFYIRSFDSGSYSLLTSLLSLVFEVADDTKKSGYRLVLGLKASLLSCSLQCMFAEVGDVNYSEVQGVAWLPERFSEAAACCTFAR